MKTRYALALAGMLLVPAAFAVDKPMPPGAGMGGMPMMEEEEDNRGLNLNETQKQQVQAIYADAKTRHEAIRQETRSKIRALLTPEQQKAFDANNAKQDEQRKQHMMQMQERKDMHREKMQERMQERKNPPKENGKPPY